MISDLHFHVFLCWGLLTMWLTFTSIVVFLFFCLFIFTNCGVKWTPLYLLCIFSYFHVLLCEQCNSGSHVFFAFCSGLQPQLKLFWIYRIRVLYYIFYSGVKLILSLYRLSWFHSRNKDCKFRAGPSMMPCEAIDSKTSTDTICAFLLESIASPLWIGKEDDREVMWKGGKDWDTNTG